MSKASEDDLSALHGAVARVLTDAMVMSEDDNGRPVLPHASYIAAAITLLKNNNVTAGKGNQELDALRQALENKRTARRPTLSAAALEEAAELFGQRVQ